MSLRWSVEDIPNFAEDWPQDEAYVEKYGNDTVYLFNPLATGNIIVDNIIWGAMAIGIGNITHENVDEVWQRWTIYEAITGAYLYPQTDPFGEPMPAPRWIFERLIGLRVNVSYETQTEFLHKMMLRFLDGLRNRVKNALDFRESKDVYPPTPNFGKQLPDDLFWQIVWNLREQEPKTSEAADSEYILDKLFEWRANADYEGDDRQEYASILTAVPPFKVGLGDFLEENSRFHRGGHEYDSYHHARRVAIRLKGFLVDADYVLVEDFTESED